MRVQILRSDDPQPWDLASDAKLLLPDPEMPWDLVIAETGMNSGAPSIALRMDLPEGHTLIAQTSLGAWLMATAAFRGAFPEAFVGTPFEAAQ
jgi:hypothetical protein